MVQADGHVLRAGVPARVGQGLLHDPVGRQLECRRQRACLAVDRELRRQPGPRRLRDQGGDTGEAGLRRAVVVLARAHRAEQAAHLRQRLPAGALDVLQRVLVRDQRGGQVVPDGAGLQHHDADGVGDDVVQLAGDAGALLRDREPRRRLPARLGLGGALMGGDGVVPANMEAFAAAGLGLLLGALS